MRRTDWGADHFDVSIDAFINELFLEHRQSRLHHLRVALSIHVPLHDQIYVTGRQVQASCKAAEHIHLDTHTNTHIHTLHIQSLPKAVVHLKYNKIYVETIICFITAWCTIVQSVVLRSHVVRPSDRLSVGDIGGSGTHRLKILETNCANN